MFFKTKVSAEQKGELVAGYLPSFPIFDAEKLSNLPRFRGDRDGDMPLLLELFAFYLHFANRMAFMTLGADQCSEFSHRLLVTVANRIATSLNKDFSSVQVVAELRDKYNEREDYYANFQKFVPDEGERQRGTLVFEFARVICILAMGSDQITDMADVVDILLPEVGEFMDGTRKILRA